MIELQVIYTSQCGPLSAAFSLLSDSSRFDCMYRFNYMFVWIFQLGLVRHDRHIYIEPCANLNEVKHLLC